MTTSTPVQMEPTVGLEIGTGAITRDPRFSFFGSFGTGGFAGVAELSCEKPSWMLPLTSLLTNFLPGQAGTAQRDTHLPN